MSFWRINTETCYPQSDPNLMRKKCVCPIKTLPHPLKLDKKWNLLLIGIAALRFEKVLRTAASPSSMIYIFSSQLRICLYWPITKHIKLHKSTKNRNKPIDTRDELLKFEIAQKLTLKFQKAKKLRRLKI